MIEGGKGLYNMVYKRVSDSTLTCRSRRALVGLTEISKTSNGNPIEFSYWSWPEQEHPMSVHSKSAQF